MLNGDAHLSEVEVELRIRTVALDFQRLERAQDTIRSLTSMGILVSD
jgi:hypothetical protein